MVYSYTFKKIILKTNTPINFCSKIGKHCIINTNSTVEHDNTVRPFSHISVGNMIAGNVTIGKKTWVGSNAVVVKNIDTPGTYIGVPAKILNYVFS